jgi:hypothetical protein
VVSEASGVIAQDFQPSDPKFDILKLALRNAIYIRARVVWVVRQI